MAITASYDTISQDLTVTGDTADNPITVSRDAAGTLLVNSGTVPVSGGPATVANTDLIEVLGGDGNDTVALDETNGALPAAEMVGGLGNDGLTGGSGTDTLLGEAGNDTLLGRGGADFLDGGDNDDILAGGDGNDQIFGGLGNDRLIWNPGDDTDLWEGGDGADTGEVNGGGGAEVFTITANGTRVRFDRLDPAPFSLDIGTTEELVLNAGGGDDSISATGNLAALIDLTLDGGLGNDTILGGNGADFLIGGDGNDFVDGQQGNDAVLLGVGDDVFRWDPGDGNDTIEGQAGTDTLLFNGSAGNEIFTLSANGGRTLLTRDLGAIVMDLEDVERFTINALGGSDTITINDLSGTDAAQISIDLAGTIGGSAGDGLADMINANATNGANIVTITGSGTGFSVTGLPHSIDVANAEAANDRLTINGLGGDDGIDAGALLPGVVQLTIDGGAGHDTIAGSAGADTILGGDGNDVVDGNQGGDIAFLGGDNDQFRWDPGDGSDVVEGQAGVDELAFNGSDANETINIAANGGRVTFLRDVASVLIDLDDVELFRFNAVGGADNVVVGDLTGTDTTAVDIHLAAAGGGGDGMADTVTVNNTNGADMIAVSATGGGVAVSGLPWSVSLFGAEAANDRLVLNGFAGDDVIDASALAAGLLPLTINAGLGADVTLGSAGNDLVNGGDGNDLAFLGAGNDIFTWNPGDDNDTIEGQAGSDTLQFNGSNVAENITISPNGGRALLFRDVASVTMDLDDTETIRFAALGGIDNIVVDDLSGTDVAQVVLDLASTAGGASGDAQVDTITLQGSGAGSAISLSGSASMLDVTGLPRSVTIAQIETSDRLTILAGDGNDTISTEGIANLTAVLTLDGGSGNDRLQSTGDGTYRGGVGNDLVLAGLTSFSEAIDGGDGIDTLDTRTFNGLYTVDMVTGSTNFSSESFINFERLITGNGADTITGTAAANVIRTTGGIDNVTAGDGNDVVEGGADGDTLDGGGGIDTLDYLRSGVGVAVSLMAGTAVGGDATGDSFGAFENLSGSAFDDVLTGDLGVNRLTGLAGNDDLDGGGGTDRLVGGLGNDTYFVDAGDIVTEKAGEGTDRILAAASYVLRAGVHVETLSTTDTAGTTAINLTGNERANNVFGNAGTNILSGGRGDDRIAGFGGSDTIVGGSGADEMNGGTGDDRASYAASASGVTINLATGTGAGGDAAGDTLVSIERLIGSSFADAMTGSAGSNALAGMDGNDTLNGGAGNDNLLGGDGDDTLIGADGADTLNGGAGIDRASYAGSDSAVTVNLATQSGLGGHADGDTLVSIENLIGSAFTDALTGSSAANSLRGENGNDTINAGAGNDVVQGGSGADTINGGNGNDVLAGQTGNDILIGGAGNDVLAFEGGGGSDRVSGFQDDIDTLRLDDNLWGGGLTAAQVLASFARQNGPNSVVFDFGGGEVLTVNAAGLTVSELENDILII